jgi:sirohydrochlorin ferrochelatase
MRHPRVTPAPLIAVAHGSRDPRAAATVASLLSVVRTRAAASDLAGLDVRGAFLDHAAPSVRQVLSGVAESHDACAVVPLLLTAAYHSKTDIPAQVMSIRTRLSGLDVRYAGTLGPHPLLLGALERRLAEAGVSLTAARRSSTSVVLAAAGSSDPAANATIAALAARWQAAGGWRAVVPAYASAVGPRPGEAVRSLLADGAGRVVVATYLLAPGYFADKIRDDALRAGARSVCAPLGSAPEVADVILDRYEAAVNSGQGAVPLPAPPRAAAGVVTGHGYPERSVVAAQLRYGSAGQTNTGACADAAHARRRG